MNKTTKPIKNLLFDPNNYRLRNSPNFKIIASTNVGLLSVQKKTQNIITGKNNKEIIDLIESFKTNGYLRVDNILVRKLKNDKYLIIEGNRRVATLKYLQKLYENGEDIGKLDPNIFDELDVVIYNYKNEKDYLILMGLKHVSGNKKWERYNQAKLLYELKNIMDLDEGEIASKLAISKKQVTDEIRGYIALEQYMKTLKGENYPGFNPYEKIMIMIELTNKPKLRNWVGWKDEKNTFSKKENLKRFYSWITPSYQSDEDSEEYELVEPILINHKQVRELEEIIDDEEALEYMEEQRDIRIALEQNSVYTKKQFSKTIKNVEKVLRNVRAIGSLNISKEDKKLVENIITYCQKFLA